MNKFSLICRELDISDSTFSFTLFYETSDKFAEFFVRKEHGATNALKKYKIIKLARGIVSLLHESNN